MTLLEAKRLLAFNIALAARQQDRSYILCCYISDQRGVTLHAGEKPSFWLGFTEVDPKTRPDKFTPEFLEAVELYAAWTRGPSHYAA